MPAIINIMGTIGSGKSTIAKTLAQYISSLGYTVVLRSYAQELKEAVGKALPGVHGTQADKGYKSLITKDMSDELVDSCFKLAHGIAQAIYDTPEASEYFVNKAGEDFVWLAALDLDKVYWSPRKILIEVSNSFRGVHADCFYEYSKHKEAELNDADFIIYDDARHYREIAPDGDRHPVNVFLNEVNTIPTGYPSSEIPSEYISTILHRLARDVNSGINSVEDISVLLHVEGEEQESNSTVVEVCDINHSKGSPQATAGYIFHDIYDTVPVWTRSDQPYNLYIPKLITSI